MKPNNNNENDGTSILNAFERRKLVIESVLLTFKKVFSNRRSCKGKHYLLWIDTDQITLIGLTEKDSQSGIELQDELMDQLEKKGFECYIEIRQGVPNGDPTLCVNVDNLDIDMYLSEAVTIINGPDLGKITKARITLNPQSPGSLKQPSYEIDAANAPYYIGRTNESNDTQSRMNDIEIIDDTRRVSRTHAHIGFSSRHGFYLQTDKGSNGTPNSTRRISRKPNYSEIDLNSLDAKASLNDGDIIVLNKFVKLLFSQID